MTAPGGAGRGLRCARRAGALGRRRARPARAPAVTSPPSCGTGRRRDRAARGTAASARGRGPAPATARPLAELTLLRRSLAAERATAILLAVLTVVTTAFLVAVPRVESRAHDRALGDAVSTAVPAERDLGLRLTDPAGRASRASTHPDAGARARPSPGSTRRCASAMGPEVPGCSAESAVAAQSDPLAAARSTGSRSTSPPPSWSCGSTTRPWTGCAGPPADRRAPATTTRTLRDPPTRTNVVQVVPVALSDRTADGLGRVGGRRARPVGRRQHGRRIVSPTAVVVSGTYEPLDPPDEVWAAEPRMLGIAKILTPEGGTTDQAAVIAPLESYSVLGDGLWRGEPPASRRRRPSPALDHTWRYTLDADRLTRDDVEVLRRLPRAPRHRPRPVGGRAGGAGRQPRAWVGCSTATSATSPSPASSPRSSPAGSTALAVLVLALTALLGAQRRDREVRLLRARGASRAQVLGLVGVATSVLARASGGARGRRRGPPRPGRDDHGRWWRWRSWSSCRRSSRSSPRPAGCAPSTRSPRSRPGRCGPPAGWCSRPPSCSWPCSPSRRCAAAARSSPPGAPTGTPRSHPVLVALAAAVVALRLHAVAGVAARRRRRARPGARGVRRAHPGRPHRGGRRACRSRPSSSARPS